jgi:hypothetical protein
MARIKLKYDLSDIKTDLYTFGKEWTTEDGQEYIGLYHQYVSTGEIYTGANWDKNISKKLIKFFENSDVNVYKKIQQIKVEFQQPFPERPVITDEDQKQGYFTRYFLKKFNELQVIEISKKQYNAYQNKKIDNNAYVAASIKWYITGNAAKQNSRNIEIASKQLPQLQSVLNDVLQFYTDTDYNVPADINGLK